MVEYLSASLSFQGRPGWMHRSYTPKKRRAQRGNSRADLFGMLDFSTRFS